MPPDLSPLAPPDRPSLPCGLVATRLAAGEPLSPSLAAHVDTCARCTAARGLAERGPAPTPPLTPPVPTLAGLRARHRAWVLRRVGAAAAAVALVAAGLALRPGPEAPAPPPVASTEVPGLDPRALLRDAEAPLAHLDDAVADEGLGLGSLADEDPLADLSDPTDLFDDALPGAAGAPPSGAPLDLPTPQEKL